MKQALTAKGGLDVWMRSSELALENMGVEQIEVDEASQQITGVHPEKGSVAIDYMIPEEGKTRMVITVDDASLIDDYKHAVAPVFRSVVTEMKKAEAEEAARAAEQAAAEKAAAEQAAAEQAQQEALAAQQQADAASEQEPETQDYNNEIAYEKPAKREGKSAPKKKSKAPIIILIIVIIAAVLAAGYFLWYRPNHQSSTSTTTTTTDTTDTDSDSSSDTTTTDGANTDTTTDSSTSSTAAATLSAYDQVVTDATSGMSYDQVKALFNNQDGQQLSDSTYQDESGNEIHTQVYYWTGNGGSGSNATVTFSNGVATQKSQYDLQ